MLQPNLKEFSLVNRHLVYDFMIANEVTPLTMSSVITPKLRKSVETARLRQKHDQDARKKELEKSEREQQKEAITNDIRRLKSTKEDVNNLCSKLEKDYNNLMQKAAEEKNLAHVYAIEALSLKRTRDEELKKIQTLDESIEVLNKKRKEC